MSKTECFNHWKNMKSVKIDLDSFCGQNMTINKDEKSSNKIVSTKETDTECLQTNEESNMESDNGHKNIKPTSVFIAESSYVIRKNDVKNEFITSQSSVEPIANITQKLISKNDETIVDCISELKTVTVDKMNKITKTIAMSDEIGGSVSIYSDGYHDSCSPIDYSIISYLSFSSVHYFLKFSIVLFFILQGSRLQEN